MTVTAAILTILAGLVPVAVLLFTRWLRRRDDPARNLARAHRAIVEADATTVNVLLDDAIRRRPPVAGGASPGAPRRGPEPDRLPDGGSPDNPR